MINTEKENIAEWSKEGSRVAILHRTMKEGLTMEVMLKKHSQEKKEPLDMWGKGIPYRYNVPGLRWKDAWCFEATKRKHLG